MAINNENNTSGGERLALILALVSIPLSLILFGFISSVGSLALSWKSAKDRGSYSLRNKISIVIAVIGFALSAYFTYGYRAMFLHWNELQDKSNELIGQQVPDFQWRDIDGNTHTKQSIGDKILVINIWGTWCPPCKREIPHFSKLSVEFKDSVQFIGISQDDVGKLNDFREDVRVSYPLISMNLKTLPFPLNQVVAFPTTFLVSPDGRIKELKVGFLSEKTLHRWLSPEELGKQP